MASELIPLAEAISALREQLAIAVADGEAKGIKFEVGPVELEFSVVVEREGEGNGKVSFKILDWGFEGGGGGKLGDKRTQSIKLTLKPVGAAGGKLKVNDPG